jgi:ABC-type nickel/cobalt efflux system permease component RcnA
MQKLRRIITVLLTLLLTFGIVPAVWAHPLGNFTINHYAGLRVSPKAVAVDFVLDMAEIPAFQEIAKFDANGNGQPDPQESAGYHPAQCETIRPQLDLRLNGQPLALKLTASSIAFPPGAGGLLTLRLSCEFSSAPLSISAQPASLEFADKSYAERIGWREIVVTADGIGLTGSYSSSSLSQRLTAYPQDMLTNPLDQRQVTLGITPAAASAPAAPNPAAQAAGALANRNDGFTELITLQNLTPLSLLFALLVAFVWGALHAVTPGHGKTIVGAYLVGSRGTAKHAFYLGLTTTITHTAGVFALGMLTLFAERYIVPEQLFPWLSLTSGLLVAVIGVGMFFTRLRAAKRSEQHEHIGEHLHSEHDHGHEHSHDGHPHTHSHAEHLEHGEHDKHTHTHSHVEHLEHDHEHGEHTHSHLPPGANGEEVTWRSILALGISGGILPCPSALIVLLSAIALGKIAFGLVLVLAFSAGLASVLSGIGILFVYAGRLFQFSPKQSWILRLVPVGSALVITLAGLGVSAQALAQMGWIKL